MSDGTLKMSIGEEVGEMTQLKSLTNQLNIATAELNQWQLIINGKVNHTMPDGFTLALTINKPNGQGFIEVISEAEVAYYVEDPEALVEAVVDKIADELYKRQIRDIISPTITRGLRNAFTVKKTV